MFRYNLTREAVIEIGAGNAAFVLVHQCHTHRWNIGAPGNLNGIFPGISCVRLFGELNLFPGNLRGGKKEKQENPVELPQHISKIVEWSGRCKGNTLKRR